jgi:translation initiation factor IF-3
LFSERRCFTISTKEQLINEEINEKEVRVIGADNEQLGIMSSAQALDMAIEADLDLVLIAPSATPPVCRIMDYGKFRFEQSRRKRNLKRTRNKLSLKRYRCR